MPFYKFNDNDLYVNTLTTHPQIKVTIYNATSSYNNTPYILGRITGSAIRLTSPGDISLYELNVDRQSASTGRHMGPSELNIADNGLIYPFVVKDGTRIAFRTTTANQFNNVEEGNAILGTYPLTASVSREYYENNTPRYMPSVISGDPSTGLTVDSSGSVTQLYALKNTLDYYTHLNYHFAVSSSLLNRDLTASLSRSPTELCTPVNLVSIPSIFYGDRIQKGTVNLEFYYTGTLAARAQDKNRDGTLIGTYGETSGSVIGVVLYNEGFLVITSSTTLNSDTDNYDGALGNPKWIYFASSISGNVDAGTGFKAPKSSWIMNMSGTNKIQTLSMFATAPKGELNHSNNPTYASYSTFLNAASGTTGYTENQERQIKNIVSSSFADPTGSFEKTTYISKIGIFDKDKNLIAIAKPSMPVKKTAERDFTFKIKLDI